MRWDPQQYTRYADERGRPFVDLVARVGAVAPRRVVDVGCGPGNLTALLAARWPDAAVEGIDSSPEMIATAAASVAAPAPPGSASAAASSEPTAPANLSFRVASADDWTMPADADVLVSNATLQWVPSHRQLLASWAAALPAGGWLAFQVPGNFDAPSHRLMRELASSPRWAPKLQGVLRHGDAVDPPADYAALLLAAGLTVDAWETTYLHVLPGADPVLEWLRGTGLRPVLAALSPEEGAEFSASFGALLRAAYPATAPGTILPFRRIFAVAHKEPS